MSRAVSRTSSQPDTRQHHDPRTGAWTKLDQVLRNAIAVKFGGTSVEGKGRSELVCWTELVLRASVLSICWSVRLNNVFSSLLTFVSPLWFAGLWCHCCVSDDAHSLEGSAGADPLSGGRSAMFSRHG